MTTVLHEEHEVLARLIEGAAMVAHSGLCELCDRLGVRRQLDGLAEQIRAVNNTPHKPSPTTPRPKPEPADPPKDLK